MYFHSHPNYTFLTSSVTYLDIQTLCTFCDICMNIGILGCIDLFFMKHNISDIYNVVTVRILKLPNRLLKGNLFLTPLIRLRYFYCILNTALLSFTPPKNIIPYFSIDSNFVKQTFLNTGMLTEPHKDLIKYRALCNFWQKY
jgi:hypothetical protein